MLGALLAVVGGVGWSLTGVHAAPPQPNQAQQQDPPQQQDQAQANDAQGAAEHVDFARDVRPIFATHCFRCHGSDTQESGFRLDKKAMALAGGDSGDPPVVPGKPEESWIWRRTSGAEPDLRMPPEGAAMSEKDVAVIRRWIEQGANWPESADAAGATSSHWSYQPLQRPELPRVANADKARSGLDLFVLAKLEAAGLAPAAEASREILARRVSLALTGLPPSVERLDALLADKRPNAYELYVDELLASPAFGERWARVWLDLARYADTQGYEKDNRREIWRYRDYVIDSFNADKPYDVFTIEQLAGDLLPDHAREQVLATAFHRNTMTNTEGGTDDEEFRVAAVVDRVNTTMEVWMGTTMGCAQCHTHKYDPITQREYYEFFAFFNNTEDSDKDNDVPHASTPTLDQRDHREEYRTRHAELTEELKQANAKLEAAQAAKKQFDEAQAAKGDGKPQDGQQQDGIQQGTLSAKADDQAKRLEAAVNTATEARREIERQIAVLDARWKPTQTPILRELAGDQRRTTNILNRGNFMDKGDEVSPGVPEVFNHLPPDDDRNRLALAHWLMDRENPLTARVMANRAWEQLFGIGLVETSEDFGTQGEPPSHPRLLDWLALDLMDHQWSIKSLCREIVLSATFRQSSDTTPDLAASDPRNRLLARGPRFRLSSEAVRDQALAAAGLLSTKVGGPSVMPPQPDGVWQVVYNGETWRTSNGDDKYRRALYTFWRRTSPYPAMMAFDSGSREFCMVRRIRTNTPLQALVTLNDPAYLEAAAALAAHSMADGRQTSVERARYAFRACLARLPSADEQWRVIRLFDAEASHYREHPEEAAKLLSVCPKELQQGLDPVDHAAWTVTINMLMNLDEFLSPR